MPPDNEKGPVPAATGIHPTMRRIGDPAIQKLTFLNRGCNSRRTAFR